MCVCVCAAHVTGRLQTRGRLFVHAQSQWTGSSSPPHFSTCNKTSSLLAKLTMKDFKPTQPPAELLIIRLNQAVTDMLGYWLLIILYISNTMKSRLNSMVLFEVIVCGGGVLVLLDSVTLLLYYIYCTSDTNVFAFSYANT